MRESMSCRAISGGPRCTSILLFPRRIPGTSSSVYSGWQIHSHAGKVEINDFFPLLPLCANANLEGLRADLALSAVLARLRETQVSCGASGLK
jgi:hypothetical protein